MGDERPLPGDGLASFRVRLRSFLVFSLAGLGLNEVGLLGLAFALRHR
jgi:hypothetical protein